MSLGDVDELMYTQHQHTVNMNLSLCDYSSPIPMPLPLEQISSYEHISIAPTAQNMMKIK